jgi:hypothetical protein
VVYANSNPWNRHDLWNTCETSGLSALTMTLIVVGAVAGLGVIFGVATKWGKGRWDKMRPVPTMSRITKKIGKKIGRKIKTQEEIPLNPLGKISADKGQIRYKTNFE